MGQVWRQLCKNENTPTLSETQMFVGTLVSGNLGLMWICAEFSRQEASNDVADLRWSQTGDFLVLSVAAIRNYPLQLGHSYRTSLAIEIFSIAAGFLWMYSLCVYWRGFLRRNAPNNRGCYACGAEHLRRCVTDVRIRCRVFLLKMPSHNYKPKKAKSLRVA